MIQAKVPTDIRRFKTKVVGPFTIRQAVCLTAVALADLVIYSTVMKRYGLDFYSMRFVFFFTDLVILAFFPDDMFFSMPLEKVFGRILELFLSPPVRKTDMRLYFYTEKDKKQVKKRRRTWIFRKRSLYRKHPEYRPYW